MKIKDILNDINNEQKLALEQVLNLSGPELIVNKDRELTKKEYKEYQNINKKLEKGQSIQYILKKANFYGNEFYVNRNVLIPRPETEELVRITNELIKKHLKQELNILDIGTGSGIIAITLKKLNNTYNVTATDISRKAIRVAQKNSKKHNAEINFIKTDLYNGINDKYDVIISNPPYLDVNSINIEEKVRKNEPHIALFAKNEGLYYYDRILQNIGKILKNKYIIAFEIGENQGLKIKNIANKYLPKAKVFIKQDYNNHDRYVFILGGIKDEKLKNI
ncbi:MAG: peptide chain release factor N(5)-glutamine methyltransferase [Bacilli bacterium]|nr:peptide chain release factor N(5)-glutamine methyltransferase [Bacilli bacterium]